MEGLGDLMTFVLVIHYCAPVQATVLSVMFGLSRTSQFPWPAGFLWFWWGLGGWKKGKEGCFLVPASCREMASSPGQLQLRF